MSEQSIPYVRVLILEAIRLFGGQSDGMFNSAAFAIAVRRMFDLDGVLDGKWCARVLKAEPGVRRLSGGCHWIYQVQ